MVLHRDFSAAKSRLVILAVCLFLATLTTACQTTGTAEESTFVGADPEKPYVQIVDRFNNNRQLVEEVFLDGEDQPVNNEEGYALMKNDYDSKWQLIKT